MRNFLTFLVLGLFFCSCQADRIALEDAKLKSEQFITGQTDGKGLQYAASEGENPAYYPKYLHEATGLSFSMRDQAWQEGAVALNNYLGKLIEDQGQQPDLVTRVDMQVITYMNFDRFIFQGEAGTQKSALAAQNLERLITYTKPWEWRILAEALIVGSPALSRTSYQKMQDYIILGAKNMLKNPKSFTVDQSVTDRLRGEAEIALRLLEKS